MADVIEIKRGTTVNLKLEFYSGPSNDREVEDLTGATVDFSASDLPPSVAPILVDAEDGIFRLPMTVAETNALVSGEEYGFDIRVTYPDGSVDIYPTVTVSVL